MKSTTHALRLRRATRTVMVVGVVVGVSALTQTSAGFADDGSAAHTTPTATPTTTSPAAENVTFDVDTRVSQGSGPTGSELRVRVNRSTISVAERLIVEVVWTSPSVTSPRWPEALDKIEGFTIVSRTHRGPEATSDGRFVFTHTMTLEPFLPGEREIPAIELALPPETTRTLEASADASSPFRSSDVRSERTTGARALITAPITIKVTGLVGEPPEQPEDLIKALAGASPIGLDPPARVPAWRSPGVLALVGGVVLVGTPLLIAAASLALRRRPLAPPSPLERLRAIAAELESDRETPGRAVDVSQRTLDQIAMLVRALLAERLGPSVLAATMPQLPHFARSLEGTEAEAITEQVSALSLEMDNARFAPDASQRHAAALAIVAPLRVLLDAWDRDTARSQEARV